MNKTILDSQGNFSMYDANLNMILFVDNKGCFMKWEFDKNNKRILLKQGEVKIHTNINELVKDYIANNPFLSLEEIKEINSCDTVIEDIIPSGNYIELKNGKILELKS